jgi:hypothetical protein
MEKLTIQQKKKMIEDAVILSYKTGYSSYNLVGKPLSHFDYEKLLKYIKALNGENIEQGGDDFFEYNTNYPYNY